MQLFLKKNRYVGYKKILKEEFDILEAPTAKGMTWEEDFSEIDINELIRQINNVKKICQEKNIFIINYPKTLDFDN